MFKAIDNAMAKNGSRKVDNNNKNEEVVAEEPTFGIASVSGNVKLTRNLYKNSDGTYTYYGYWDWTDGYWDSYADIEDLLAIRSSKVITTRVSSYIYSYDNYGYDRSSRVARRSWEADGAVFNLHDYLGYGWGGVCQCIIPITVLLPLDSKHQLAPKSIHILNITIKNIPGLLVALLIW